MKSPKSWLAFKVVAILVVAILGFFILYYQQIEAFAETYWEVTAKASARAPDQRPETRRIVPVENANQHEQPSPVEKSLGTCGLAEDCPVPTEPDHHAECNEEGFCVAVKNAE